MLDEGKIDPEEQTLKDMDALQHDEQMFYRGFLAGYEAGYAKCVTNLEELVKKAQKGAKDGEEKKD